MLCPRCDHQGDVVKVEVKATGDVVYICDECDALWERQEDVGVVPFQDFSTYMELRGLKPNWRELLRLND